VKSKLARKLRRDLKANPKKALVLGLLVAVALYSWAPLVRGWLGQAEAPLAVQPVVGDVMGPERPPPATVQQQWPSWREALQLIAAARQRLPQTLGTAARNPFTQSAPADSALALAEAQRQQAPTPSELGFKLQSTLVGGRGRLAIIDGGIYGVGESLSGTRDGRSWSFVLIDVGPDRVILEGDSKRYELPLVVPALGGQDRIAPAAKADHESPRDN
jgi:hypothetical protein